MPPFADPFDRDLKIANNSEVDEFSGRTGFFEVERLAGVVDHVIDTLTQ